MSSQYRLGECKRKRQNGLLGLLPHSLSCLPSVRGGPRGRVTEDTLTMAAFVAVYSLEAFFLTSYLIRAGFYDMGLPRVEF